MEEIGAILQLGAYMLWEFGMSNLEAIWDVATHPITLTIAGVQIGFVALWILVMV